MSLRRFCVLPSRFIRRQSSSWHEISDTALEELSDKLETILESHYDKGADVSLTNGVLTVIVDKEHTYVINKQSPNRQVWLSSPISGPKRFNYESGKWLETRSKTELKELLSIELSDMLKKNIKL